MSQNSQNNSFLDEIPIKSHGGKFKVIKFRKKEQETARMVSNYTLAGKKALPDNLKKENPSASPQEELKNSKPSFVLDQNLKKDSIIKKLQGPNENFPNKPVSLPSLDTPQKSLNNINDKGQKESSKNYSTGQAGIRKKDEEIKDHWLMESSETLLSPLPPTIIKSSKPIFMFHPEDEEEVARLVGGENSYKKNPRENIEEIQSHPMEKGSVEQDEQKIVGKILPRKPLESLSPVNGILSAEKIETKVNPQSFSSKKISIDDLVAKRREEEARVDIKIKEIMDKLPEEIFNKLNNASKEITAPLAFSEVREPLLGKFKHLLKTRIKGARNNIMLWQALIKKENEGGVGLEENEADEVIKLVSLIDLTSGVKKDVKKENEKDNNFKSDSPSQVGVLNSLNQNHSEKETARVEENSKILDQKVQIKNVKLEKNDEDIIRTIGNNEELKLSPMGGEKKEENSKLELNLKTDENPESKKGEEGNKFTGIEEKEEAKMEKKLENSQEKVTKPSSLINFMAANRSLGDSGRPRIEDIKYKPKLVGPVEELAQLQIRDFRQLSDNPQKAADIIRGKIDNLGEEALSKKVEAIKAWRESEIYKTYLELGSKALMESKNIKDLGNELKAGDKKYLTEEEFYAIMDLNKTLRF